MAETQSAGLTREALNKMFNFEVEFKASGVRREDGLTAAQVKAELNAHKEKMNNGS